jgi:ATP-dependent helicase/nuclease subunit A
MLLLSSPPAEETGEEAQHRSDWRVAVPRPGALFVVGDPKQSIYRFRRADIQLYGFVKGRFAEFGEVLSLSTNFRSRPPIGDLVNQVFNEPLFFPTVATPEQAAFERLDTLPPTGAVPDEGVFVYDISPESNTKGSAAEDDAARISSWIRDRVDSGERVASDFLILTRDRGQLAAYARAIEARGLPVSVTGAGVGVETEIQELRVLLECMIDPTNPVKVVAALVGLFFGIDYERLTAHRLGDGGCDAMWPGERGHPEVVDAIRRLHGWWRTSVADPADIFVGRITSELGLLPYAASGDLGTLRAGALLYALDAVRAAALAGDTSLPGALAALDSALELREAEAPLEPLRADAIRLMNLHQAKGLEGTVVILANPTDLKQRKPDIHLSRSEEGVAEGFLRVAGTTTGFRSAQDLARPMGWSERQELEERFEAAEEVRLLYVAVTRAREELLIARWPGGRGTSPWAALEPWLETYAERIDIDPRPPTEPEEVDFPPEQVRQAMKAAAGSITSRGTRTFTHTTVTSIAKTAVVDSAERGNGRVETPRSDFRGFSWGSAVHGALAAAASEPADEELRSMCRNLLVEYQRPLDDHGEPTELRELLDLVRTVRGSGLWSRAQSAEQSLTEISFAAPGPDCAHEPAVVEEEPVLPSAPGKPQLDLFGGAIDASEDGLAERGESESTGVDEAANEKGEPGEGGEGLDGDFGEVVVLEGVIDLAFREKDGWVIADYKTDIGTDPEFPARKEAYRRQVDLYADAWSRLTGERVKERVLYFTAQERVESW